MSVCVIHSRVAHSVSQQLPVMSGRFLNSVVSSFKNWQNEEILYQSKVWTNISLSRLLLFFFLPQQFPVLLKTRKSTYEGMGNIKWPKTLIILILIFALHCRKKKLRKVQSNLMHSDFHKVLTMIVLLIVLSNTTLFCQSMKMTYRFWHVCWKKKKKSH